jgi:hypothetical protein
MKRFHLIVFTLLFYTLSSCNKNNDKPEEPDNTPLQLVKRITRYEVNGQVRTVATMYTYDPMGHLIATVDSTSNQPIRKYIYNGDNLIALIDYINGVPDTLKNPIKLLDGGNTILLDHTRPNPQGGMDTIQITYKWSGNQLLEAWTYLHFANSVPGLQKKLFSYNPNGNEYEETLIASDGSSHLQRRALAYDQKKNYFNSIPRLNYIFGGWGFPDASRSVNNPVKAEKYDGTQVEYIWTYNDQDYPLTMQVKGQGFIATELYYNK